VRKTLQRYIVPGQFRITSGFIATPDLLRGQQNLPQCDILIVDRNMPALLRFEESGIEVVPRESVCGIIEVKRALTRRNIRENGAFAHLASIIESIGKSKDLKTDKVLNTANLHVGLHNHSSNKPLLGVIALKNEMNDLNETASLVTTTDSLIDFVWTLDGHALVPNFQDGDQTWFYTHTARPETRTWGKLGSDDFRNAGQCNERTQTNPDDDSVGAECVRNAWRQ